MAHRALYRKWRPLTFDEVCGQEHITSILKYETEHKSFSHAYLFCGSRGTGKTTCAKILSRAVNCLSPIGGNPCGECEACRAILDGTTTDVLEMDAASNNGVDNIRDIRDEVIYTPSQLQYRVYIIDEVHMLSTSAFNALLKTLEEPPEHVVFILATTELGKLPATIISRCQRFDFRRIAVPILTSRLQKIAEEEKIEMDADAAVLIARQAQGGMRDAISLLELCSGGGKKVTVDGVNDAVGSVGRETVCSVVRAIAASDYEKLFAAVASTVASARDIAAFWQDLISFYRDLLIVKTSSDPSSYLDLTDFEKKENEQIASLFRKETLLYHISVLENALGLMQRANALKRVVAETSLVKMCDCRLDASPESLLARISELEDRMAAGMPIAASAVPTSAPIEPCPEPPVTATEPVKPTPAPKPASGGENKRILKPLRIFPDVLERVRRQDAMTASFLEGVLAYTDESDRVVLRFPNEFSMMMLDRGNGKDMLRGALSFEMKRDIPDRSIVCESVPTGGSQTCFLDEIIEDNE